MTELTDALTGAWATMPLWEVAAVALAILYLLLAIRQNMACWIAAIASAGIYTFLMYEARLYMESVLQLFYIAMAVYGWFSWQQKDGQILRVVSWPLAFHVAPFFLIGILTVCTGSLLGSYTDAAAPYLDSFTTWGAIVTTWMVARKVLQNWHYWLVIDSVSVYLYLSRGLLLTALLFVVYLALIIVGLSQWRRSMLVAE